MRNQLRGSGGQPAPLDIEEVKRSVNFSGQSFDLSTKAFLQIQGHIIGILEQWLPAPFLSPSPVFIVPVYLVRIVTKTRVHKFYIDTMLKDVLRYFDGAQCGAWT